MTNEAYSIKLTMVNHIYLYVVFLYPL